MLKLLLLRRGCEDEFENRFDKFRRYLIHSEQIKVFNYIITGRPLVYSCLFILFTVTAYSSPTGALIRLLGYNRLFASINRLVK